MVNIIGLVGALFILFAWIPETYITIKTKNVDALDIKFFIFYIAGNALLAYYSFLINDIVFLSLNSAILAIQVVEFSVVVYKKHKYSKSRKIRRKKRR